MCWCMPVAARPCCCPSCSTELTLKTWAPSQSLAHSDHRGARGARGACGARGPRGARGAEPRKGAAAWAGSTSASLAAASERVSGSNLSSATMLRKASAARASSTSASLAAASKRVSGSNLSSATMLRKASAPRAGSSSASLSAASKRSSSSSSYMAVSAFFERVVSISAVRGWTKRRFAVPVPCGLRREHSRVPGPACHCLAPVPGMTSGEMKLKPTLYARLHRRE